MQLICILKLNCGCCGYSQQSFILDAFGLKKDNIILKNKLNVNRSKSKTENKKLSEKYKKLDEENEDKIKQTKYIIQYIKIDGDNEYSEMYHLNSQPKPDLNKLNIINNSQFNKLIETRRCEAYTIIRNNNNNKREIIGFYKKKDSAE